MSKQLTELIKEKYLLHKAFCVYFIISVFVTVLDIVISRSFEMFTKLVVANTIGVVVGFTVQYFLTARHVYNNKNIATFIKFLLSFLIGLTLANTIIYVCRTLVFHRSESLIAFFISKGFSIVIPFFVMYFIRKNWIHTN